MQMLLFNRNEQYMATLKDILLAKHLEELNGENILEIETLDMVEKNQRLVYKDKYGYWHEFIIKGVDEIREDEGVICKVFAESSFYETWGDYVEDKRPYDTTANIALENALLTSRWEVGIVDDLGINSTNFYHISVKEAVQKVAETWQGEIRTRVEVSGNKIIGRYVDLLAHRGEDRGRRFTYTKDLQDMKRSVHRDDVITALYGYGKGEEIEDDEGQATGGFGRRLDFADINDGKAYVEDLDALAIWGRLNPDGTRSHVFGEVEFDDCEDPEELLALTTEKLTELSQPLITYEATVTDPEGAELGDMVAIIDREFEPELRLKARGIKIVRDLLEEENTTMVWGNYIPSIADSWLEQEQYISNFRDRQGIWDRANQFDADGNLNTQYLDGAMDVVKNQLLATKSGWYTNKDGDIVLDAKDGTSSMMISGAGFMIADTKSSDGSWDYSTFGTGKGFVANYIIAGVLQGGRVKFDLTNGTLLIGNSVEDYQLFWDGTTLYIKGNIDLSGNQTVINIENTLTQKISKDHVISEINQSAEEVQINANRLKIGTGTTFQQGEIYTWERYIGMKWNEVIA